MLRNRKFVKSFTENVFEYQTNRSGDSFEENNIYKSSSSSDTLSSDLLSGSSVNSSTSSITTSSDNSSEFYDVEKVIEEYFIRKLSSDSLTQFQCLKFSKNYNERTNQRNIEKSRKTRNLNLFRNSNLITMEVSTQVSCSDFIIQHYSFQTKRNTLRSISTDILHSSGIWTRHKDFKLYLNKSDIDANLYTLFQNSYSIISRYKKLYRYTLGVENNNFMEIKQKFNEYFSHFNFFKLAMSIDDFSPFKAIMLLDKITSKIVLFNDKAKLLFKFTNSNSLFFDHFIIKEFQYVNLLDYFVDVNGKLCFLPAKLVKCRDSYNYTFYTSLRLQKINSCDFQNNIDPIIMVIEPLNLNYGLSLLNDGHIIAFNNDFINILRLQKLKNHNIYNKKYSDLHLTEHLLVNYDLMKKREKIQHNVISFSNECIPVYFLSICCPISNFEAKIYTKIHNLHTKNITHDKENLYANVMWFYSNISYVLIISLNGKIRDCDPFFSYLVGYSINELLTININEIIKFNSFEFDAILLLQNANGKYDVTILNINKLETKATVWIKKRKHNSGLYYVLWFVTDAQEFISLSALQLSARMDKELIVKSEMLSKKFNNSKINKSINNLQRNSFKVNKHISYSQIKKSHSLPETYTFNVSKASPWSLLTNVEIKECNTPSDISDHFKEISLFKNIDIFHNDYNMLNIIGKGAFGFVRLATSKLTNEEFVVKFIRKRKLTIEHMVKIPINDVNKSERRTKLAYGYEQTSTDNIFKHINNEETFIFIPREIWMLSQLNHQNIVSLHDWYEGINHYQLVMPKHGVGMDLFEFIDRSPLLDEMLVSHIFHQLSDAVAYLHALMISHRDIKDENIILNNVFQIKLIDFGAAVKVEPGQKFKTFCGTMEFCSPEILLGQEYNSFHADIWSMGITLYTIMFGENPFYDFEETINAVLKPPKIISSDLFQLLSLLLEPNPINRITAEYLSRHVWLQQKFDITKYSFEDIIQNSIFCGNMASDFRKYSNESNCGQTKNKSNHSMRTKIN